jgi:DNA-binding GntR family transcriptional regulator
MGFFLSFPIHLTLLLLSGQFHYCIATACRSPWAYSMALTLPPTRVTLRLL